MAVPKIPLKQGPTGLGKSVNGVTAPSGINQPKVPMLDKRQNVAGSNLTKTRWGVSMPRKMGNH